jgi:hypothetical protein
MLYKPEEMRRFLRISPARDANGFRLPLVFLLQEKSKRISELISARVL